MRRPGVAACWLLLAVGCFAAAARANIVGPPRPEPGPQPYPAFYDSIYGAIRCYADALVRPKSTEELAAAVKQLRAGAAKAGKAIKIRVGRPNFHATSTFSCPGAFSGGYGSPIKFTQPYPTSSAAPSIAAVMTDDLTRVLSVDRSNNRIVVQGGMRVDKILKWAEENGFSVPRGSPCTYSELSLAGVIVTGGHGVGRGVPANPADIVTKFTWVDANGEIHHSDRHSPEGRAIAGGTGLIGILTEAELQMTPPSMTKALSRVYLPDDTIAKDFVGYLKESPWTSIIWRPDLRRYSAFTLQPATGQDLLGATMTLIPNVNRLVTLGVELFYYPWQQDYQNILISKVLNPINCAFQSLTVVLQTWAGRQLPIGAAVPLPVAVASTNKISGGGCEGGCAWDNDLAVDDIAFAIEQERLPEWIEDIRKIMLEDLQDGGKSPDKCMGVGHYLIRAGNPNNDYTAPWGGLKQPVMVELSNLRNRRLPDLLAKFTYVQEISEQLLLCKYKGRPHFGKNFDRTYTFPKCPMRDNFPEFDKLLEQVKKYDPDGVFESPLHTKMIKREGPALKPGCALRKECYCEQDVHCGQGYRCIPSRAFPEYNMCAPRGDPKMGTKH